MKLAVPFVNSSANGPSKKPGYSVLPKYEMRIDTLEEVAINWIWPWTVKVNYRRIELNKLTCIDTVSNLVQWLELTTKCLYTQEKVHAKMACKISMPILLNTQQGWMQVKYFCSLVAKWTQANSICECMHKKVENSLHTLMHNNPPYNMTWS